MKNFIFCRVIEEGKVFLLGQLFMKTLYVFLWNILQLIFAKFYRKTSKFGFRVAH